MEEEDTHAACWDTQGNMEEFDKDGTDYGTTHGASYFLMRKSNGKKNN